MSYQKCNITAVKPYDYSEFYHNSYNIQNMLITQYNFPKFYYQGENDGDFIDSVYTDRIPSNYWKKAIEHISLKRNLDSWDQVSGEELIAFANELYSDSLKDKEIKITGIRIVRYTNFSSGNPTWRIDTFGKHPDTPNNHTFGVVYEKVEEDGFIIKRDGKYYKIDEMGGVKEF